MGYLSVLLDPVKCHEAALKAAKFVRQLKPDILIGTGTSGILACQALSLVTGVPIAIARKSSDNNNHGEPFEVEIVYKRWVMVDDFVVSGDTFRKLYAAVEKERSGQEHECLGIICMVPQHNTGQVVLHDNFNYKIFKYDYKTHPIRSRLKLPTKAHDNSRQLRLNLAA